MSVDQKARPPHGLTEDALSDWRGLLTGTRLPVAFSPSLVAELPEPVRRWLLYAIAPETPLRTSVELTTAGHIRLSGGWRPFTATQRISPAGGFVWAATARVFGLPVVGFDRYTRGVGQLRWRLLDVLPLVTATGADITRSAAGRHAGELLLAAPAAALSPRVSWRPLDADRAVARIRRALGTHGAQETHEVTLTVRADGALTDVAMSRWGKPGREPFAAHPFGATLSDEISEDGFTIPGTVTAGWFHGTDQWDAGQFIRYTVEDLRYR
ncbi:DUF6544 family protein [Cryptosporangium minutisporangium]|uniref:Uncharacterized protein n=1 Tax=Cryptosporangium minutisporangium TaxID=113569 RepID=A0ABP6SS69_9ACTN